MTPSVMRAAALYRQASYSPNQHRTNDTAILDATVAYLEHVGWTVSRVGEDAIVEGALPEAPLILNMCQGPTASERLLALERRNGTSLRVRFVNRPSSVLGCHRHRLVDRLAAIDAPQ